MTADRKTLPISRIARRAAPGQSGRPARRHSHARPIPQPGERAEFPDGLCEPQLRDRRNTPIVQLTSGCGCRMLPTHANGVHDLSRNDQISRRVSSSRHDADAFATTLSVATPQPESRKLRPFPGRFSLPKPKILVSCETRVWVGLSQSPEQGVRREDYGRGLTFPRLCCVGDFEMKFAWITAALVCFASINSADAGLFHRHGGCCAPAPSCCAPAAAAPSCCAPVAAAPACAPAAAPSCCAPVAPSCCAPTTHCCKPKKVRCCGERVKKACCGFKSACCKIKLPKLGCCHKTSCCAPAAPTCCAPAAAPTCCAPAAAPTCAAPAAACCN